MSRNHSLLKLLFRTAAVLGAVYAVNEYIDRTATEKKLLTYHSAKMFTWREDKVYNTRQGSSSPMIKLHNLHPASSSYEWHQIVDQLAKQHTVYTLDLPGMGRSDKCNQPYTNFYYVECLKEFITEMKLEDVSIVASNLTSAVALMAAVYEPSLFSRLVMISPPSKDELAVTPDTVSKCKKALLELPLIGTLCYNILCSRQRIDLAFTEKYLYNPFHENVELVDTCYEAAHLGHGQGRYFAAALIGGYLNINIDHALSHLSIPTLVLEGGNIELASVVTQDWTSANAVVTAETIPHTKELPHLEEPALIAEKINAFLSE